MKQMWVVSAIQLFMLAGLLHAGSITVTVPGTAGPWDQILNPAFNYGVHDNDGPVVVDGSSGIVLTPGVTLRISYLSGLVSAGDVHPLVDANGDSSYPPTNNDPGNGGFPAHYMGPGTVLLVELVGTFANNGVIVGTPFAVGDGPANLTVPAGANELLLGINDNFFKGTVIETNKGSFLVDVSTPEPGTAALFMISSAMFAGRWLKRRASRRLNVRPIVSIYG